MSVRARRTLLVSVLAMMLSLAWTSGASARAIYLFANHHSGQFDVWDLDIHDGTVAHQATYQLQCLAHPSGVAIWESFTPLGHINRSVIFVTSEFSGSVEVIDPTTLNYIQCIDTGGTDLAGIALDSENNVLYTVDRMTNRVYAFDWDPHAGPAGTLTLQAGYPVTLPSVTGAIGMAFDPVDGVLYLADTGSRHVRGFDPTTWTETFTWAPAAGPIDLVIDAARRCLYVSNMDSYCAYPGPSYGTEGMVCRYDLMTAAETDLDLVGQMDHGAMGLAVNEPTGYLYVTGGCSGDNITVWNPNTTPWTLVQNTGVIGNPAGIVIGRGVPSDPGVELAAQPDPGCVSRFGDLTMNVRYFYGDVDQTTMPATNVRVELFIDPNVEFDSATGGGVYDAMHHKVVWDVGTLNPEDDIYQTVVGRVTSAAGPGDVLSCGVEIYAGDSVQFKGSDQASAVVCDFIPMELDIKPTSCPNPLNTKSMGVLPVALLGEPGMDMSVIDPASCRLMGVAPLRWSMEDVATAYAGEECDCTTEGPDGYMDMTFKFSRQEVLAALGDMHDGDVIELFLTGLLHDGMNVEAVDCVRIIDKYRAQPVVDGTSRPDGSLNVWPSPFNPVTRIEYVLSSPSHVRLAAYDVTGRVVTTLCDEVQGAGVHSVDWDASHLSSGIYFVKLNAGSLRLHKQVVVSK